ncbi:hypothetical protein PHLCEN_2v8211, partial [Hermanssonia centrifuga]
MVINPEVFKKAQEEIDQVVGNDRLPDFEDRKSLPYLECVLKELYRGMSRDPVQYPDPEEFLPERFADSSQSEADDYNPRTFVFGFGRRRCPGQLFADGNVYLVMANIIAAMDISREKDEHGREIIPTPEFTSGLI